MTYEATRNRLETYFDQTASQTWERLTSDAPVSRIRQTVRAGRDTMRAKLLKVLPDDLRGARVLDAGCGAGSASIELAARGACVTAVDISPSLLDVARRRTPEALWEQIDYRSGDMLDPELGEFDAVFAMDSLIHYTAPDIARALDGLTRRTNGPVAFTVAPKTTLLTIMWWAGKTFPRSDRSPAIQPHKCSTIAKHLKAHNPSSTLVEHAKVSSGFYISQAMEARA